MKVPPTFTLRLPMFGHQEDTSGSGCWMFIRSFSAYAKQPSPFRRGDLENFYLANGEGLAVANDSNSRRFAIRAGRKDRGRERAEDLPERGRDTMEEEEKDEELAGVGATALLAAALAGGALRKELDEEYQQRYHGIVSAQKSDGRFVSHFSETVEFERVANYYSGQALLVLTLEAERGNAEALGKCRRAFQPYMLLFRVAPTSAFVGWHVDVWSRLALLAGDHDYANFVFEQVDWLLQFQLSNHRDTRWVGGFSQFGNAPQFSTIVFLEATVRALRLALKSEIRDEYENISMPLMRVYSFVNCLGWRKHRRLCSGIQCAVGAASRWD
jgi:hypothetical protein